MNPQMFGALPNVPKVSQLWKDEPNKYRVWMILFAILLFITAGLYIANVAWQIIDKDNIIHNIRVNATDNSPISASKATGVFNRTIGVLFVSLAVLAGSFIWFTASLIDSYKKKSFDNLSYWAILLVQFVSLLGTINIFMLAFSGGKVNTGNTASLVLFISQFVIIPLWIAAVMVGRIRRKFYTSRMIEKRQSDPAYQALQKQMSDFAKFQNGQTPGGNSAYGPVPPTSAPNVKPTSVPPVNSEAPVIQENSDRTELTKLKLFELQGIARKLSISGSASMRKDELINAILRVTLK